MIVVGKLANPKIHVSDDGGGSWYVSAGNYKYVGDGWSSGDASTTSFRNVNADNFVDVNGYFGYGQAGGYLEVTLSNMGTGGKKTTIRGFSSGCDGSGNANIGTLGGTTTMTTAMTAFRLVNSDSATSVTYTLLEGATS